MRSSTVFVTSATSMGRQPRSYCAPRTASRTGFLVSPQNSAFSGVVVDLEQFPLAALYHPEDTEPMQ